MEIDELQAEIDQIKQRMERFGENKQGNDNIKLIQETIDFKEENKGKPEYELTELLVPIPSDQKRHFNNIKERIKQKYKNKHKGRSLKNKDGLEKPLAQPAGGKSGKWWLKNKS